MNITTLPLSYRPNRPFRILFTPFVASCIFKLCGGINQIFPINLRNLRDGGISAENEGSVLSSYAQDLGTMNIDTDKAILFSDVQREYVSFLRESIQLRIQKGKCRRVDQMISYCACGKVELPSSAITDILVGNRSQIVRNSENAWTCRFCNAILQDSPTSTLIHRLQKYESIEVSPQKVYAKVKAEMLSLCKNPLLISKVHRVQHNALRIEEFLIDPDYCWMHYLNFLFERRGLNDFVLVVGVNQLAHVSRLIMFTMESNPSIRIRLIVTPLIDLGDLSRSINCKTTLAELGALLGSPRLIRPFLSTLIGWNREVSRINFGDIKTLQKTRLEELKSIEPSFLPLEDVASLLNRHSIMSAFRGIRQYAEPSSADKQLLRAIV